MKNEIPKFTQDEVQTANDSLKKKEGKASDNNGIRAEDTKPCDETTKEMTRQICNEVMRITRISVTHKEGNVEEVGNYRPICTLPALYKLFSTLIYNRFYDRVDRAQLQDQGGFRRSHQTLDHLATYRLLEHKMPGVEYQNVSRSV